MAFTAVYNAIKNEYDRRKKASLESLNIKKQEVYSRVPEIEEIDLRIRETGISLSKAVLLGKRSSGDAYRELSLKLDELNNTKKRLLTENGFPPDYLEPTYVCARCQDTGFVENGEKCSCYSKQLVEQLYRHSNIRLGDVENFANFDESFFPDVVDEKKYGIPVSPRENIKRIKEKCHKFIENFDQPDEKNLFFSGPTGVGKTFMANCIAMEIIKKEKTVLYYAAPALFNLINQYRAKLFRDEDDGDEAYRQIFEAELLIIDDLGTESPTAARYAELLTILNTRQLNNMKRPCKTIISTNIGVRELYEYYDERNASRIIGCFNMFKFAGDDIRMIRKIKQPSAI